MTRETIRYEMSSDQATERDLAVLDAVIACGLNLSTGELKTWLLIADKVIDQVAQRELQLHLREFIERSALYASDESLVHDRRAPTLGIVYVPQTRIALSYATSHGKFEIAFDLDAIAQARF
jgi:hypothetical protein